MDTKKIELQESKQYDKIMYVKHDVSQKFTINYWIYYSVIYSK